MSTTKLLPRRPIATTTTTTTTTTLACSSHTHRRPSSTYAHLAQTLPARRLPPLYSDLTPSQSHALGITLASFLPASWTTSSATTARPANTVGAPLLPLLPRPSASLALPPAHHLVYFNPVIPADRLLHDGTDPLQSPGAPFVRRMWAGGYVKFARDDGGNKGGLRSGPVLDGRRWVCVEGIRDVAVKGREGEEKVFVGIERRVGRASETAEEEKEEDVRARLWTDEEHAWGEAELIERRNIVFMRGRSPEEAKVELEKARGKMLFPQNTPDFTHTLVPTPSLLFRYSALTFNAHAIHLDPLYCRTVEGHRNLLFHGPLSFTLMTLLLQNNLPKNQRIAEIEYRNLAPLYCDEPVKLCGRKADSSPNGNGGGKGRGEGEGKYELWVETPEGGLAVKGTAYTTAA